VKVVIKVNCIETATTKKGHQFLEIMEAHQNGAHSAQIG